MRAPADDRSLLATTLHYPYEIRDDKDYFADIPDLKLPKDMKDLPHLSLTKLLQAKRHGRKIEEIGEAAPLTRVDPRSCLGQNALSCCRRVGPKWCGVFGFTRAQGRERTISAQKVISAFGGLADLS